MQIKFLSINQFVFKVKDNHSFECCHHWLCWMSSRLRCIFLVRALTSTRLRCRVPLSGDEADRGGNQPSSAPRTRGNASQEPPTSGTQSISTRLHTANISHVNKQRHLNWASSHDVSCVGFECRTKLTPGGRRSAAV